jgi:hypothetical protein
MSCACAIDCKCLPVPVRPLPSFASRSLICQKSNGAKCEAHRPMGIVHLYALASARRPYCEKHCSTGSGGEKIHFAECWSHLRKLREERGKGNVKLTESAAIDELVVSLADVCLSPCIILNFFILLAPRPIFVA